MTEPEILSSFMVHLPVVIRRCTQDDLPNLEWFGLFTAHREILQDTFAAQERGEQVMLIAAISGAPVGQVWIDLIRKKEQRIGVLWAARVFPWLHNLGIGTRLFTAAERLLRQYGFTQAELGVETHNQHATRFYERLGYQLAGAIQEEYSYTTPDGVFIRIPIDEWVYRKDLGQGQDEHI